MGVFKRKDVIALADLSRDEVEQILSTADSLKEVSSRPIKKVPALRGRTVINLFLEPSTRTRTSFEIAAKRLSADTLNVSSGGSAIAKGEGLKDTARTIEAMAADLVVIRHSASGAARLLADLVDCCVVNAGDGFHEHPTQALLDIYTMREVFGDLKGKNVIIVGDVAHSRVARSNIFGLVKLGVKVTLVGPPTLMPVDVESLGVQVEHDLDKVLPEADVVYLLRIQTERQESNLFPTLREYAKLFGLNKERFDKVHQDAVIMHPGPMNRGVEISAEVADEARSLVARQVKNGVAVRMAVLYLLLGGVEDG